MHVHFGGGIHLGSYTFQELGAMDAGESRRFLDGLRAKREAKTDELEKQGHDVLYCSYYRKDPDNPNAESVIHEMLATDTDAKRMRHARNLLHALTGTYDNLGLEHEQGGRLLNEGKKEAGYAINETKNAASREAGAAYGKLEELVYLKAMNGIHVDR